MPDGYALGKINTLESILLIKIMRIVKASYIFEFGTFKGNTTRLLLENLPPPPPANRSIEKRVFTLDLPNIKNIYFQGSDKKIAQISVRNKKLEYYKCSQKNLVEQILINSEEFNENKYLKKFQFIFIDANHAEKFVASDTEKSFKMISSKPSAIIWHDYNNPQYPSLTRYIKKLSKYKKIYYIKDTMLAVHFIGIKIAS
jgi:hypothetical protein